MGVRLVTTVKIGEGERSIQRHPWILDFCLVNGQGRGSSEIVKRH